MIIREHGTADIATPTGPMRLHVFQPAAPGRYPGLVLYSEIYQITGPVRRMAAFLAGNGFVVVAPEICHEFEAPGTVLAYDKPGTDRGNELKFTKEVAAFDSDARDTLDWLKACPDCRGRLGVVGICLGGHLAFRAAMNRDVLAAACFYATDIDEGSLGKGNADDRTPRRFESCRKVLCSPIVLPRSNPHPCEFELCCPVVDVGYHRRPI
jgi:carboxymethylenebutenolidase